MPYLLKIGDVTAHWLSLVYSVHMSKPFWKPGSTRNSTKAKCCVLSYQNIPALQAIGWSGLQCVDGKHFLKHFPYNTNSWCIRWTVFGWIWLQEEKTGVTKTQTPKTQTSDLRPRKLRPRKLRPRKVRPRKLRPRKLRPRKLRPRKTHTPKTQTCPNLNSFQFLSPKKCYGHAMLIGSIPKTQTPKTQTPKTQTPKSQTPKTQTPKIQTPPNKLSWNITNGQRFHIKILCCIATYSLYVAVTPPLVWAEILIWWIRGNGNLRMPAQMI